MKIAELLPLVLIHFNCRLIKVDVGFTCKPRITFIYLSFELQNVIDSIFLSYLCFFSAGWFRAILPKSALRVEEEAWNAYPYTKTRYRCPFVEKFYLEIETKYLNDGGEKENVFSLSNSEMKDRILGEVTVLHNRLL